MIFRRMVMTFAYTEYLMYNLMMPVFGLLFIGVPTVKMIERLLRTFAKGQRGAFGDTRGMIIFVIMLVIAVILVNSLMQGGIHLIYERPTAAVTALTTVLGVVPMAVGNGVGSEMWNSLGMVVATGLTFSTLVTLFLIPVLFTWLAMRDERKRAKKLAQLNA